MGLLLKSFFANVIISFGTVYPDGYGINYMAGPHELKFGIESKVSCSQTSSYDFKKDLLQSLREMREVCESRQTPLKAKL